MSTYTEKELLDLGFKWIEDGDEEYLQRVLNEDDYFNSPFEYAESVGENKFIIKQG